MRYFQETFQKKNIILLNAVKEILENLKDNLPLTVRQIFYQVISIENAPLQNSLKDYKRLSKVLVKARYCGEISFDDIEDRTRYTSNLPIPIDEILMYYYPEAWSQQPNYVEVIVEKEGLRSFFVRTLRHYYVPVTPIRGFDSLGNVKDVANRIFEHRDKPRYIFVFSDFDPSGECISDDFEFRVKKRLVMLGEDPTEYDEEEKKIVLPNIQVTKVALTLQQVEEFGLHPKYVKTRDPRATDFIRRYGKHAVVELDAMPPSILQKVILEAVLPYLDMAEVERNQVIERRIKTEGSQALQNLADLENRRNIGEDR